MLFQSNLEDLRNLISVYSLSIVLDDMTIKYKGDNPDQNVITYENTNGWQHITIDEYIVKSFDFLEKQQIICRFDKYTHEVMVSMENSLMKSSIAFEPTKEHPCFISKEITTINDLINKIEKQMYLNILLDFLKYYGKNNFDIHQVIDKEPLNFGKIYHLNIDEEQLLMNMCMTYNHGFGLMSDSEKEPIFRTMFQLYIHDIKPFIQKIKA